ncbi:MAG: hypothetical protein ACLS90_03540, partial [Clostridia bacterium]
MKNRNTFTELTRVQMPAMIHLTRLGYKYFGKIKKKMAGNIYDKDTNILIKVFKNKFKELNPNYNGDIDKILNEIKQELDYD